MQMPKRKRYQKDTAPTDDIITLINLVRQNPTLYNYKLQPNQRRRIDVLTGWAEVAAQIGNKYTIEECRRKWKNLRDTYHQYRLRKPKIGDTLSKWRYAKNLDFLSNIYQPKLKAHRNQLFAKEHMLPGLNDAPSHNNDQDSMVHHHSSITLVNEDTDAFILTAYEESVNDDGSTIDHDGNGDPNMSHMDMTHHDNIDNVNGIVKDEHESSLDENGATGVEVDYEEVCLYEEAGHAAPNVDCETIVGPGGANVVTRRTSTDSKSFQYIDPNDFCISSISAHTQLHHSSTTSSVIANSKLKNVTMIPASASSNATVVATTSSTDMNDVTAAALSTPIVQLHSPNISEDQARDELDLFFDFLKKKMQRFSKEEITAIQVEFLNCVLRREADLAHKNSLTI